MRNQILAVGICLSLALTPAASMASPNTGEPLIEEAAPASEPMVEETSPASEPMVTQADPQSPMTEEVSSEAADPAMTVAPDDEDVQEFEISKTRETGEQLPSDPDDILAVQAASTYSLYDGSYTSARTLGNSDSGYEGFVYTFTLSHRSRTSIILEMVPTMSSGTLNIQMFDNRGNGTWSKHTASLSSSSKRYRWTLNYNDLDNKPPKSIGPGVYKLAVWYSNPSYSYAACQIQAKLDIKPLYSDLPKNHWAANVVADAVDKGFMSGYNDSKFGTGDSITRAQVATVLWNMQGSPRPSSTYSFRDVSSSKYYAKAVAWAKSAGVVSGYGDGSFCPDKNVSRQELAVMLHNYAVRFRGASNSGASSASYSGMSDRGSVASYARNAVGWCFNKGIMSGSNGRIRPAVATARAEAAKMFLLTGRLLGM